MLVVVSVSHDKRQNIKKYENKGPKRPGALQLLVRPQLNHAVIISAELWEREHARVGGMGGACVNAQMEGRCFVLRYQDGIACNKRYEYVDQAIAYLQTRCVCEVRFR